MLAQYGFSFCLTNVTRLCTNDTLNVFDFALLLCISPNLKRLHIQPKQAIRDLDEDPLNPTPTIRTGARIIKQMWIYFEPFAHLPASVSVTTQSQWPGYLDDVWYGEVTGEDCYEYFADMFEDGFAKMRKHFAGTECLYMDKDDTGKVPGARDDWGNVIWV